MSMQLSDHLMCLQPCAGFVSLPTHSQDHGFVTQACRSMLVTLWITVWCSVHAPTTNSAAPWSVKVRFQTPTLRQEYLRPRKTQVPKRGEAHREGMVANLVVISLVPAQSYARYSGVRWSAVYMQSSKQAPRWRLPQVSVRLGNPLLVRQQLSIPPAAFSCSSNLQVSMASGLFSRVLRARAPTALRLDFGVTP